jgi:pimeloyl-ACP methyl ester carboxylesterase
LSILKEKYTPATLPYHVIIPSLSGYVFSELSTQSDWTVEDTADVMHKVLVELGFGDGYVVQGGDIGSRIARILAVKYPACKGKYHDAFGMGTNLLISSDITLQLSIVSVSQSRSGFNFDMTQLILTIWLNQKTLPSSS